MDIADPIFMVNYLFTGGRAPPSPGPSACGVDPTEDDIHERFGPCAYPQEKCPVSE